MAIVAGVDFGTQSVRVALVDSERGPLGCGIAEYEVHRRKDDPDFATQSHQAHMDALAEATRRALRETGVNGEQVQAIALDTTGSTVVPVGEGLTPLDDYYLWCDHRAAEEAVRITDVAHREKLPAIEYCGGVYSSEWGFAKLLHWLRHNPDRRGKLVTALEHCDMVAAELSGVTDPKQVARSVCAMGHKWLWNESLGGFPPEAFLVQVDPLLAGVREKLDGRYLTSDHVAGTLTPEWAAKLGLRAGIPIPVGAFDAHWDAIGAGVTEGDVVNVIGTSTCIIAIAKQAENVPGVCGVVPGSVKPGWIGVEAGLSGVGNIFDAIARRSGRSVEELSKGLDQYRAGQTGLLRMSWDNGDRTVLVNPNLGGVTLGWNLNHDARDELFAAIEGTAFHTRIVLERMAAHGVPIERVIQGGGIPQKNEVLNRIYANVLGKPVLVPEGSVTSLGSSIMAFLAAGTFDSIDDAQKALCPSYRVIEPDPGEHATYERLYAIYRELYFALGNPDSAAVRIGSVLPELKRIAAEVARGSRA
ncbi:MAG TPA: ribulokinase [Gemmatimonadaceae bacterium]|nr:ribulokinase [Gemmatimonadaceae bacterium]